MNTYFFRHASVSSTHLGQSGITALHRRITVQQIFELLELISCNAAYFVSLLESKGEDYLIWAGVHYDPAVFQSFLNFLIFSLNKVYFYK